jgi:glycine dehydrogenase subunit 1
LEDTYYIPFLPNRTREAVERMLSKIGANSTEELFKDIPENVRLKGGLLLPEAVDEYTLRREVESRLSETKTYPEALCFLGGGVWHHYVPAVVDSIVSRQEFYTSYTPYQPEISQGMLQVLFEYQSLMCDLLQMEACNSSMYDWATAAAEAVRMASRITGRKKVVLAGNISQERKSVIQTYSWPVGIDIRYASFNKESGETELESVEKLVDDETAALYYENPNYFGIIESNAQQLSEIAHRRGCVVIVGVEPTSLSLISGPGSYGADVAVGEGQPLGIHMNYGGPHLGILAVREVKLARSMPGRLIGMTTTVDGTERAFTMVLQSREQHIRRESATSNICTNQALMALAAAVYLSLLGKKGFRILGETILSNSHYAAKRLSEIKGVIAPLFTGKFYKDFVVGYTNKDSSHVFQELSKRNIHAGYPIDKSFGIKSSGLYSVSEVHNFDDIEKLAQCLEEIIS